MRFYIRSYSVCACVILMKRICQKISETIWQIWQIYHLNHINFFSFIIRINKKKVIKTKKFLKTYFNQVLFHVKIHPLIFHY